MQSEKRTERLVETGRRDSVHSSLDQMKDGLLAVDTSGLILYANRAALRLMGLAGRRRVAGLRLGDLDLRPPLGDLLNRALGSGLKAGSRTQVRLDGREIEIQVSDGAPWQQNALADLIHDVKGPLSAVSAVLEAIADGVMPQHQRREQLRNAIATLDRIGRLCQEVVDLNRLAGSPSLRKEAVNLEGLLAQIHGTVNQRARQAGIQLTVTSDSAEVQSDADRLAQVIWNLLDNALRHTAAGGLVYLKAVKEAAVIRVLVGDTGAGIRAEHLPHVWDRSYQAGPDARGSGLGLNIVKQTVQALGGAVFVESTPGKGSVFGFTLPRECPQA